MKCRVSDILSDGTYIRMRNRETTGVNYTITSLNIGQDTCIKVLENGLKSCIIVMIDVFKVCPKMINYFMMSVITGQCLVILHKESQNLATTAVCQDYSCISKTAKICFLQSFTRGTMIINTKLVFSPSKYSKNRCFSTSAEISYFLSFGCDSLQLLVNTIANQLASQVKYILLVTGNFA